MRVLLAHNYYLQGGGEDTVFESDRSLLLAKGHVVSEYIESNHQIASMGQWEVAISTIWSQSSYEKMREEIKRFRPDVVQFYNTFPLISPSAYYACRTAEMPIVQYLFNPRLICPAASLYRDGRLCTDCIGKSFPWPGVIHGCYHHSRIHTLVVASMIKYHHMIGTWQNVIDIYLSATKFYRSLYVSGGFPAEKIIVKPNYIVSDPGLSDPSQGEYALYIGRLDLEKGVKTLLESWKSLQIPLKIRGSGQLEQVMKEFVVENNLMNVEFIGRLESDALIKLRSKARFLIWPSEGYYETFGLAAVECFAQSIPVIASRIGVMTEIVEDGKTGLLFNPGDPADLAVKVQWMWDHPEECVRMGRNARKEYEQKYTSEQNYQMLMDIYSQALQGKK
jgi:glycosyltransferase involved in cell wall biosynthesis